MLSKRLLPLAAAILLLANPVYAKTETTSESPKNHQSASRRTSNPTLDEHRRQVGRHAMNILGALSAEIYAQQGRRAEAYQYYLILFQRSQDTAAAERATELALESGHIVAARQVLHQWQRQQTDAANQPAFQRLQWQLACLEGDLPTVTAGLAEAMSETRPHKMRQQMRQLAQLINQHPKAASPANAEHIIQAAQRHPDLAEAAIAAALYAASQNREADLHAALQNLQNHEYSDDTDLRLLLKLLQERQPEQLQRFFAAHPVQQQHPLIWQMAYIDYLVRQNQLQVAYQHLNRSNTTHPAMRLQAAQLAIQLHQDHDAAQNHLEIAYRNSSSEQQSQLAEHLAQQMLAHKQTRLARTWVNRMTAPTQAFQRHIMLMRIALAEQQYTQAQRHLEQAQRHSNRQTEQLLFGQVELHKARNPVAAIAFIERILAQPQTRLANIPAANRPLVLEALRYQHALLLAEQPNRVDEAVAILQARLRQAPDNPNWLNAVGYTMLGQANPDLEQAHRYISRAHSLDPTNPAIRDSLGWVLFKQGRASEALPHLQAAYAASPDGEVAAHLIETLHQLNRQDELQKVLHGLDANERQHRILQDTLRRLNLQPSTARPAPTSAKP